MSNLANMRDEGAIKVNLGDKMADVGLGPRGPGKRYPAQFKRNVVCEVVEKGLPILSVAKRFNVSYPTVCRWVHDDRDETRARDVRVRERAPAQPQVDYSRASLALGPPPAVPGNSDEGVLLSRAEATLLAALVREAVGRIKDSNLRGQMAVLALRLMG